MTAYRKHEEREPSSTDLETAALHDLLRRMKRFRRRVALPILVVAMVSAWIGMAAHALGYWSVLGATSEGVYVVSAFTFVIAAVICAGPIIVPGVFVYLALRARLRSAWREEHRKNGVAAEWLAESSNRFG